MNAVKTHKTKINPARHLLSEAFLLIKISNHTTHEYNPKVCTMVSRRVVTSIQRL